MKKRKRVKTRKNNKKIHQVHKNAYYPPPGAPIFNKNKNFFRNLVLHEKLYICKNFELFLILVTTWESNQVPILYS
jgi:hypothetical protein